MFKLLRYFLPLVFIFITSEIYAQNCTINAGIDQTICPGANPNAPFKLIGTSSSSGNLTLQSAPIWTQIAGPAVTVSSTTISGSTAEASVSNFATNVQYTFRLAAKCQDGSTVFQDVKYMVSDVSIANAGADETVCPGTFTFKGSPLKSGETGRWTRIDGSTDMPVPTNSGTYNATINIPVSPNVLTATYRWTVSKGECSSYDDVVIKNLGTQIVNAGSDINGLDCYNVSTRTWLNGSYAATDVASGQKGTWTFVSGPTLPEIITPSAYNSEVRNLREGTYTLRWTVAGPCRSGSDEMRIVVKRATQNISSAGGRTDIYCDGRTSVVLTAPRPSYTGETGVWTKVNGAGTQIIQNPNSNVTVVTGLVATTGTGYTFRYTINNPSTECTSIGDYVVRFNPAPTLTINSASPLIVACGETEAIVNYSSSGGNRIDYALVSAPAGSALQTQLGGLGVYRSAPNSGSTIASMNRIGTYVFRYRVSTDNNTGGCDDVYKEISIVISNNATISNAGTKQVLACNIDNTNLAGNPPAFGIGKWSQVKGPNLATFSNTGNPTANVSGLINGIYTFRWIVSGGDGGCTNTQQDVDVVVSSVVPATAVAGNAKSTCYGSPVTLEGNAPLPNETGTWTVRKGSNQAAPEVVFSSINNPNATATGLLANTAYTFTWTLSNSCNSNSSNVVITTTSVQGPKQADAGLDRCLASSTTNFALAGNAPTGGETGTWVKISGPNATITNASLYNTTVTGVSTGNYVFQWRLSNAGGCATTVDDIQITISETPTTANAGVDQNICGSSTTLAGNQPAVGQGTWTQTEGAGGITITDPNLRNTTVTGLTSGRYKFVWTITNGACIPTNNSDEIVLNVSTPPEPANAGPDQTLCNQTNTTLAANIITNGTGRWAAVSGPTIPNFVNFNSPTTSVGNLTFGVYELEWISSGGLYCPPSTDRMTITVTQNAYAGTNQTLCDVTSIALNGNANSIGTWTQVSGPNTATINATEKNGAIVTSLTTGVYIFRYTIGAIGSCAETSSDVTYNISAPPTIANAGADQSICETNTANITPIPLNANTPTEGTGMWSVLEGPGGWTFSNTASATATFRPTNEGVYLLKWEITNGSCAGNSASSDLVRIVVSFPPTVSNAGVNQSNLCTNNVNLTGNTPARGLGTWTQVSGPNIATINQPNSPATTVLNTIPGTYVFRWTIKNGICNDSASEVTIAISSEPPTQANAGVEDSVCTASEGGTGTKILNGNQPTNSETGAWTTIAKSNGAATPTFANATIYNTTVSGLTAGSYTLRWTLTNGSCSSFDDVLITVGDPPSSATITSGNQNVCLYQPVNLTANAITSGIGTWSTQTKPNGTGNPIFNNVNGTSTGVFGLEVGTYTFIFTVRTTANCTASVSTPVQVIVNALPTPATSGSDKTTCFDTPIALTGNTPSTGNGVWTVTSGQAASAYVFSAPNSPTSNFTGKASGEFTVRWTISNGSCSSFSESKVTVREELINNVIAGAVTEVCSGGTPTFSPMPAPSGGSGVTVIRWERAVSNNNGATFSGYTSTSVPGPVPNNLDPGTIRIYRYRRIVFTQLCGSFTSNVVEFKVYPVINSPTPTAPYTTICYSGISGLINGGNASGGFNGYTYQWQKALNAGGTFTDIAGATGADYDPGSFTNTSSAVELHRYRRVVTSNGCIVNGPEIAITVNPRPALTSATTATTCSNNNFSYTPTSAVANTTFNWSRATVANINNTAAIGAGAINETLINNGTAPVNVTYVYTLTANGCQNPTTYNVTVTVNPSPRGTNATITDLNCTGSFTYDLQNNINQTTSVPSTFTWNIAPNANVSGIGTGTGSGSVINGTLYNNTSVAQQVVYTVTPTANTTGSCAGQPFTVTVNVPVCPGMTITKTTTRTAAVTTAGDLIPYTIVIRNTANANQSNVVVRDPFLSANPLTNPTKTGGNQDNILERGEIWTYIGTYVVTQADLDNNGKPQINSGQIVNTASVTSTELPATQTASTTVNVLAASTYTVAKNSSVTAITTAGQVVPYEITVANTGNTAISNLLISDPMLTNIILFSGDNNTNQKLDKGETWIYRGSHTVLQSDLDANRNSLAVTAGTIRNVVTVSGRKPNGDAVYVTPPTAEKIIPINAPGSIEVKKNSITPSIVKAGQVVPYTITIANTGKVAVSNITVADPLLPMAALSLYSGDIAPANGKLDVNETWTYRGNYTVTQADIDNNGNGPVGSPLRNGFLRNTAIVTGIYPNGNAASANDTFDIPINAFSAYSIQKTADLTQITAAGQEVKYTITVKNTGDAALSNVVVTDPMFATLGARQGDLNNNNKLDLNETWTYTQNFTVTQAILDANGNNPALHPGMLSNTASVRATNSAGTVMPIQTTTLLIPLNTTSSFTITKTANQTQITAAGQVVTYTLTVKNTGTNAVRSVVVTDPMLTSIAGPTGDATPAGVLDINETWVYTGNYTVKQIDLDNNGNITPNGQLSNTVNVTGNKPDGTSAGSVSAILNIPLNPTASFALTKTSNVTSVNKAGDLITYTVTARNTGAVAVNSLVISDPMLNLAYASGDTNTNGKLDLTETWVYSGTYRVTQADIDNNGNGTAGKLINEVTATARNANGILLPEVKATRSVDVVSTASYAITKASSINNVTKAGQVVPYIISVSNTGTVAISNVRVTDPLLSSTDLVLTTGDSNADGKLDVNETWNYIANYIVTQAMIDNRGNVLPTPSGNLVNTATVSGNSPTAALAPLNSNEVSIPIVPVNAFAIAKTSPTVSITTPGQVVPYTITVTNTGDAALANIVVNDSMLASGALTLTNGDANNNGKLDVNETWNYLFNYTVTQANIDQNGNTSLKGVLSNTATLSGATASGVALTNLTATKIIPLSSSSSFTVNKASDRANVTKAGDIVNYTITVTNTGNTSINNVSVTDPLLGNSVNTVSSGDTNTNNVLDVNEVWTYTGSYTVTQADIDNNGNSLAGSNISSVGNLINIATVTGNKPDGSTAGTVSATNLVPIQPTASFVLAKSSDVTEVSRAGDQVVYTVTARNTGAVAINTLIINDPMLNLGYLSGDLNGNGKLDVNETWTYRGTYTVKQSDIDNNGNGVTLGKLVNRVTANGRKPDGSSIPEVNANHALDVNFVATMNVQKTTSTKQITKAGQVVDYTITVANTGNVAISDVVLNDPLLPSTTLYSGDVNSNNILDVRETWTYNGSYTVTQSDIDVHGKPIANSGNLVNTASVAGKLPSGTAINGNSNVVTIPIEASIAYSLTKESATTAILNAGQQVPYTITVKNIGDAGISDIVLNDPMVNLTLSSGDVNTNAKLDVNETWIYNGVYTVTQSDIDNYGNTTLKGVLSNTVTLSGKKPNGTALPTITASKVIPLNTTSLFTVVKTADRTSVQKAGDIINYAITINNTGVTAISNVKVDDPLLGGIIAAPSQGDVNANNKLDVGETWTYRGAYTVTQADMDRNGNLLAGQSTANGRIINLVNVSGDKPDATTAGSLTAVNEVPIAPIATFTLTKTADVTRVSKLGDRITYTVVAKNTGTVAISTFTIIDPMMPLGNPVGDVNNNAKLDVNETWTYKGIYTVSQADIDNNGNGIIAGKLVNTVNAGGRRPDGTPLTPVIAIANVDVQPISTVRLTKASATTSVNIADQVVPYTITLVNTGTVAVSDVIVADPMLANLSFSNGDVNGNSKLDVNETWTYVGSYTVTQGDIDNQGNTSVKGNLVNTATANGKNPDGTAIATVRSTKTIPVQQTISLNFTKVVTGQVGYIAGQTVTYEIKVGNTGNTTMKNIVVSDANATITSGSPIAQLNPGQVATVTAVHTLSQPDVDAGRVINQATLTAVDANGGNVNQRSDDPSTAAVRDATVTQIVSPGSISLVKTALLSGDGNTITYNFTVKNSGIITLSDVVISDTKIRSAITVNPSVLPPGATGTATATYTISAIEKAAEQVTNTAIVTATSPNGFKVNDVSGTTENNNEPTLVILPKITGTKSVSDANGNGIIEEGEVLTYTITISNNGSVNRTGVSASDQLPANMTYVNGSASNGGVLTAGTVEWSNLTIPANGSLSVNFKATITNNLPLGLTRITNMASISNPAEPATPVLVETSMPTAGKLESTKTVNDAKGNKDAIAQANETLTYHIVLKNSGGSMLTGIKVSDMLPTGLSYITGTASNGGTYTQTGNVLNWTLDLAPGVSANLVFDAKVVADVNGLPSLRNVASIVSPTGQTLTPEITMATDPSADLVITKELIATAPVRTGDRIAYKITVANAGQNKATGVTVTDILPGSLDAPYDIVVTKGTSTFVANGKTLTWAIGDLALNELVTVTFKTRVVATGSLVNTATVTSNQPDPISNSNSASSAGSPIGGNDLFIPNLFTPNGDGNNDRFEIRGLDQFPDNELVIVNRWGNEVFRTKNYQNNWTGEGLNEGTYYYLLKAKNNADTEYRVLKGWVTLIRAFKK